MGFFAEQAELRPLPLDQPEVIAIDLDGTLLADDGSIGGASAMAIEEAKAQGMKIVLATGRPPRAVRNVYNALGLDTPVIAHNGAVVFDPVKNKVLLHHKMPGDLAGEVIRVARQAQPQVAAAVEVLDSFHTDRMNSHLRDNPMVAATQAGVGTLQKVLQQPVTKVVLCGEADQLGGVQMALSNKLKGKVEIAVTHLRLLIAVKPGVDKAAALQWLTEQWGVDHDRVMAIGDAPNDSGMIEWCGLGIAMGNAWDEVRKAAHFVVADNNDDGVGQAIRHYALNKLNV